MGDAKETQGWKMGIQGTKDIKVRYRKIMKQTEGNGWDKERCWVEEKKKTKEKEKKGGVEEEEEE